MKRVWGGTWFGVTSVAYNVATGLGNNGGEKCEHGGFGEGLRPTQRGCRQPKSGRQTFTRKGIIS